MLRLPDVLLKTGLSRSQIYRLITQGSFPTQIQLGSRASGWIESEIDGWLAGRIALSREGPRIACNA
ncbi:MAG: AlpA family transcriptional regulator [Proteobacteria bacterium]|nr:AlpA family transcriptional regulator [Pseudomonadota bacterium]